MLLLALILALEAPAPAPAAEAPPPEPPKWTVSVDPLTFSLGYAHIQVERKASKYASVYLGPHTRLFDGIFTRGHEPFLGFGTEIGVRVFPWGKSPKGPWIMARQVLATLVTTDGSAPAEFGGYSSVLVGYTAIFVRHLVLSGGVGFNYLYYDIGEYGSSGPFVALHTNIGVAF